MGRNEAAVGGREGQGGGIVIVRSRRGRWRLEAKFLEGSVVAVSGLELGFDSDCRASTRFARSITRGLVNGGRVV